MNMYNFFVVFGFFLVKDLLFDGIFYKEYIRIGIIVDFVVWFLFLLYKNGFFL